MAEVNGFLMLTNIGKKRELFDEMEADVNAAAKSLATKIVTGKKVDLKRIRGIRAALGEDFALIVENLAASKVKTLCKKLDPHFSELKTANERTLVGHIVSLADNEVEPASGRKSAGSASRRPTSRLTSKVMDQIKESEAKPTRSVRGKKSDI